MMNPDEYQPSIFPFGLRIDQPVTAITDLPIALVCFYAVYQIAQWKQSGNVFLFFKLYFLCLGFGTLWAGFFSHAFLYVWGEPGRIPGWIAAIASVSMISLVAIEQAKNLTGQRMALILKSLVAVQFFAVAYLCLSKVTFHWARVHLAVGMLGIVTPLYLWEWYKNRDRSSQLALIAVTTFIFAGMFFAFKFSLDLWFNHVDASHLFLALPAFIFYKAAQALQRVPN